MNKALKLFLALLCVAGLQSVRAEPEKLPVRVVTPFPAGHLLADTAAQLREELAARLPRLQVELKFGVLDEQRIDPAFAACARSERVGEILLTGGQPIQDYAPAYFFFNGPYVIRDFAHLQRVWRGPVGQAMGRELALRGRMINFEPVYRGLRQFTALRPIAGPADFAALKLRLPPTPDWVAVWQSLGVQAVQVPLPGIHEALRSGAAQASEGDLTQIRSLRLNEVQSQLVLTDHLVGFGMQLGNACFVENELQPEERAALAEALAASARWGSETFRAREAGLLRELEAGGMQVQRPDAQAIRAAAEPAIRRLFAERWTVTDWATVLAQ